MTTTAIAAGADTLEVRWPDGRLTRYPYIWLRDSCPSGFHPQTQERTLDLLAIDPEPKALSAGAADGVLTIEWAGDGHVSRFPLAWLAAHRPGEPMEDPAAIAPAVWRSELASSGIRRHRASAILADDGALEVWLTDTARDGITIVEGISGEPGAGLAIAERAGLIRETYFGRAFEVLNKPDPNNLAFTAAKLPLHIDLPHEEVLPGFQFLHCIANEAVGGGSVFADGYAIAQDLRTEEPEAFRLLTEIDVPFRFHDMGADIRTHAPIIKLGRAGDPVEIRYNAHIAAVFDMPADIMPAYYRAYRAFMARTRRPEYLVKLKLAGGEMVVFDNRRILHGRDAFDPNTGFRHLRGCYVDRGEFDSRLRVLARKRQAERVAA